MPGSPLIALAASAGVSSRRSAVALSRATAPARLAACEGDDDDVGALSDHRRAQAPGGGKNTLGRAAECRQASARAPALDQRRSDPGVRCAVGQREHHAGERDPVCDAVVHAVDDRRAGAESVDQVAVPQRAVTVERHAHEVSDELLQGGAIAGSGQREVVHVVLEREIRVVLPARRAQGQVALDDPLAEARVAVDQTRLRDLLEALPVQRPIEQLDGVDHHQVGGAIHVQPRRVGAGQVGAHHLSSVPRG